MSLEPKEIWGVVLWVTYPLMISLITGICMTYAEWKAWYAGLNKSPYTPANWTFGLVWPVLYCAMAISGALVYATGDENSATMHVALSFHFAQLIFNGIWTPVFFFANRIQLAMLIIGVVFALAVASAVLSALVSPWTLFCYLPYLAWVGFAGGVLNLYIVQHNDVEGHDNWFDVRSDDERRQQLKELSGEKTTTV